MPRIDDQMAGERLRATRDERYRTNVDFMITQTRRVVALGALLWVITSGDVRSAACEIGPLCGARDAIVGACDARPTKAQSIRDRTRPPTPRTTSERPDG